MIKPSLDQAAIISVCGIEPSATADSFPSLFDAAVFTLPVCALVNSLG